MRIISASEVETGLDFPSLVERLRDAFRRGASAPLRQSLTLPGNGRPDATLLLMPAWLERRYIGVKIVTVVPDNPRNDLPTVMGTYMLLDGGDGRPLALIDGPSLTRRRTAATSALAAKYLARPDCERLLMVGTGALAPYMIEAHAAVRPIANVLVWGRNLEKADRVAARLNRPDFKVEATDDLEPAVRGADIVCCATTSETPLVPGAWLPDGVHLDLVGGFTEAMRETDDAAIVRGRIFVDNREAALAEAGDIIQPIESGAMTVDDIAGDLADLTRGSRDGRRFYDQITLFKSVGTGTADLAAATQALERS
jgi:ornithine cyclodeaminase